MSATEKIQKLDDEILEYHARMLMVLTDLATRKQLTLQEMMNLANLYTQGKIEN